VKRLPAIAAHIMAAMASFVSAADWRDAPAPNGGPSGRVDETPGAGGLFNRLFSPARAAPAMRPHPAVVRVIVPERGSTSYGSGTLVDARGEFGLVVTNWHVVCDAAGPPTVVFPDGFRSAAQVVKVDRDWDLAALAIWKPSVAAVPLAPSAPRPGESLSIAGYGGGPYRQVSGACTQYVAPGRSYPMEMVELAASARQGDSGGPIFNSQGELAGVLFGEGHGRTAGSYCGRVRHFLTTVLPDAGTPAAAATSNLAAHPESGPTEPATSEANTGYSGILASRPTAVLERQATVGAGSDAERRARPTPLGRLPPRRELSGDAPAPIDSASVPGSASSGFRQIAGETRFEQLKSIFAAVGALALVGYVCRVLRNRRSA